MNTIMKRSPKSAKSADEDFEMQLEVLEKVSRRLEVSLFWQNTISSILFHAELLSQHGWEWQKSSEKRKRSIH